MADEETPEPSERSAPEGLGSRLFDHARKAREQAAAKATELAGKAGEMKDQAAARAGGVKDQVTARAAELKDAGVSRVGETVDEFNAALPAVREAGYSLTGVDIQIGLPPKVVAKFSTAVELPEEKVEALLAKHGENKFTSMLLRALFQASRLQARVKIAGLNPSGLDVEIGLSPHVTIKFG